MPPYSPKLIGLLAFQGAFAAHGQMCQKLDIPFREVRTKDELEACTHLILPGGESTTILKLLEFHGLIDPLLAWAGDGKPIFSTCAGLIVLAREVFSPSQTSLGVYNVAVERNAYGRQVDSFETDLPIPSLGDRPFHAVFIRSPIILSVGENVEVLGEHAGHPVIIRQDRRLATTFHPELTDDTRIHELFFSF